MSSLPFTRTHETQMNAELKEENKRLREALEKLESAASGWMKLHADEFREWSGPEDQFDEEAIALMNAASHAKEALSAPATVKEQVRDGEWAQFKRKGLSEMRPYVHGEDVTHISISEPDRQNGSPKEGDMIARNPKNHADQWLVAEKYFNENLEPV